MKKNNYKAIFVVLIAIIILQAVFIITQRPAKKPMLAPPVKVLKGRIAIVLDDWGYNLNNLHITEEIKLPITASILPNLPFSKKVAEDLHDLGFQVILHLPMQPHENFRLEKNTISPDMDKDTIVRILNQDLDNLRFARGVSNHMGSLATEDTRVMGIIFKELKKKSLFFLDSFVTPKSVCFDLSGKIGVGFVKRDVFLDNINEPEYIKRQIYKLKIKARSRGYAVGIGHDRKVTLETLKKVMPELENEGYKFVFLSDLVK